MHSLNHRLTYRVYGQSASGNCHKVRLTLDILGLSYRWHELDVRRGETHTAEFLAMNPNGKVPLLQIDSHRFLPESNAILCFLADGTALWPGDRYARAQVLQWMFFEQYSHEPYIAVLRYLRKFVGRNDDPRIPELQRRGHAALQVMQQHLAQHDFFVAQQFSIADIALFAYTHKAEDSGFDMSAYPAVTAWLARCRQQADVTDMPEPPALSN